MDEGSRSPTLNHLIALVLQDSQLSPADKKSLIDELRKNNPGSADRWTYRWAIFIFGGIATLAVSGLLLVNYWGHAVPDGLVAIGSAAIGGLAGVLVPARSSRPG